MRKSSNPSALRAALPGVALAAVAGLALLFAATVRADDVLIWSSTDSTGTWDLSGTNWIDTSGTSAVFKDGNAVVFGLDADGNPTNGGGHITINGTNTSTVTINGTTYITATNNVTVGAQDDNPGVIIASGSWRFAGGDIKGGSFLITGSSAMEFIDTDNATDSRYFEDQRFDVVDNAEFKLLLDGYNTGVLFTGTTSGTLTGGAIHTGSNSNLTFGLTGTTGGFYFQTNTTSQQGGAIYAGGNVSVQTPDATAEYSSTFGIHFTSNFAGQQGGAIYSAGDVSIAAPSGTTVILNSFIGNKAGAEGGAIYSKGDVTLDSISTFASNTAGASGGAIYAEGDVTLTGSMTFDNNTAGLITITDEITGTITGTQGGLGGAIYTAGNLTMTGSSSEFIFYNNRISNSGVDGASSMAYVGGTFTLSDNASLFAAGGITAQDILITSATLKIGENYGASSSALTLTTIDSNGAATAGIIRFEDATLYASYGTLAVNEGSKIEISGSAFTINAVGTGMTAALGGGTIISAEITGTAELIKTGTGVASLSSTNTYTGATTIEAGTLWGNIPDSSTLTIKAGATYTSGSYTPYDTGTSTILIATDRTIDSLNGEGTIDMSGATLTANSGNFLGTIRNTTSVVKLTTGTLVLGSGTVGSLDIGEGALNIGGDKTLYVSGTTTVAAGASLGVNVSDSTALLTGALETVVGSIINITGIGNISSYDTGTSYTVIITDTANPITRNYTFLIDGKPIGDPPTISEFLTFAEDTSAEYVSGTRNNEIAVATTLVWNSSATAHGTFQINSGTFNLVANLERNTDSAVWFPGWDGNTLTKTGAGTLILSGSNSYTGTTYATDGTLINNGYIQGDVGITNVSGTNQAGEETYTKGLFVNTGTVQGNIYNAGNYIFQSSSTFVPDETTDDDPDAEVTGSTVYWNGAMNGNLHNTGTALVDLSVDYEWSGTLSGDAGILVKTGTAAFTLNGDSTYSGTVQVDQGAYVSAKADNLNSVSTYVISSTSGTLSLGGYSQSNLKTIFNNGVLSFGPAATAGMTTFATATIANYTTRINDDGEHEGYGIIDIRSNYNAGLADSLVITGTASGTHAIRITNSDNITPDKSRPYILLISGDGVVASNTNVEFIGAVDVGMGRLIVARGDNSALSGSEDNWYLASGNQVSNLADAILSTASVAGLEWHYQLDTVRQRMGDLRQEALMAPPEKRTSPLAYTTVGSKGGNAWLRGNAYHLDADASITTDAFDEDVFGIAFGYDKTYRWEDNQYLLGAFVNISNVSRDFETRGDGSTDSYGGGFYFSYLKDNGWYGDTSLLITRNNNSFTARPIDRPDDIIEADYSTYSWGLSIEVGKIIKNKKTGWWLEPSAQAALAVVNGRTYTTNTDMEVKMADANIYQFRAALRAGRDVSGTRLKPYVRAAVANVNTTGGRIRAGSPDYPQYFTADVDGNRFEAGAGVSWVIDERSQLYLDYEYAKASSYSRPWAVNFGYRSTW